MHVFQTRILVTHGITHLHEADLVVVIKDGAVSEIGTFTELVNSKGAFSEFLSAHLQEVDKEELDGMMLELMDSTFGIKLSRFLVELLFLPVPFCTKSKRFALCQSIYALCVLLYVNQSLCQTVLLDTASVPF